MGAAPLRFALALRRNAAPVAAVAMAVLYSVVAARLRIRPEVSTGFFIPIALYLAGSLLRRLRFDRGTIAILLGGIVLYFLYLTYTTPGERNYDGPEQIKYLTYIADNSAWPTLHFGDLFTDPRKFLGALAASVAIPPAKHCFICHHPPLYYLLAAVAHAFFQATRLAPNPLGVQLFSLLIFFGFLVYGALLAKLYAPDSRFVRLAAAVLVLWPYSFHNCVRIHNDTLATTLVAAGMYHAARWYKEDRIGHLYAAAVFAALGLLTKSTAYALVGSIGLMLAYRFFKRPRRARLLGHGTLAIGICAAAFGLLSLRAPVGDDRCHRMFGTACDIRAADYTGNKPINYLYLDVPKFLREPYMVIANDSSGKQYFWNHVLKSSLFGTHNKIPDRETAYTLNRGVAWYMNAALLGMLLYAAAAGLLGGRRGLRRYGAPLLFAAMSAAVLMAFKIMIPAPHHTDFRHIYFVMAPGAVLLAAAVDHMRRRRPALGSAGMALAAPFLAASAFYFLPKYDLVMKYMQETVELQIASVQKVVPEGAPWDKDGNILIEGNQTLAFSVSPKQEVASVDISVDGNDTYEIRIYGEGKPRALYVKPRKVPKVGLARHTLEVQPPMKDVTRVTLKPVSGDRAYSLGHLILSAKSPPRAAPSVTPSATPSAPPLPAVAPKE